MRPFIYVSVLGVLVLGTSLGTALGGTDLEEHLLELRSPDIQSVRRAQDWMQAHAKEALPPLRAMLKAEDAIDRRVAALTLALFGEDAEDAVQDLRMALRDTNTGVRVAAAEALGTIGAAARRAVPDLEAVRNEAWWGHSTPVEAFPRPLELPHAPVVLATERALSAIRRESPLPIADDPVVEGLPISQWVRRLAGPWTVGTFDTESSTTARDVLAKLPAERVLPHLLPRLRGVVLGHLLRPRFAWPDLDQEPIVQLGHALAPQATGLLAEAASWAVEHHDLPLLLGTLHIAHEGKADLAGFVPAAVRILDDTRPQPPRSDPDPAQEIAWGILMTAGPSAEEAVPLLLRRLRGDNPREFVSVMMLLGAIGPAARAALPQIRKALKSDDPVLARGRDALEIARIRIQQGRKAPLVALRDKSAAIRRWAVFSLKDLALPETEYLDTLETALADEDVEVRCEVAWLLLQAGNKGFEILAKQAPKDTGGLALVLDVAARAARTYFENGEESERYIRRIPYEEDPSKTRIDCAPLLDAVMPGLLHSEADFRRATAIALGGMGPKAAKATDGLRRLLEDEEWTVRLEAAEALGQITQGTKTAVPDLLPLLRDEQPMVRAVAAHALARIGPEAHGVLPDILAALHALGNEPGGHREMAEALAVMATRDPALQTALVECLEDPAPPVRAAVADALGRVQDPNDLLIAALAQLLQDEDRTVRGAAANTLVTYAAAVHRVVPQVESLLAAEEPHARAKAAEVLARIGYPARTAIPALMRALEDDDLQAREAASTALRVLRMQ